MESQNNEKTEGVKRFSFLDEKEPAVPHKKRSKFLRFLATLASSVLHPVFYPTAMIATICWLNLSGFAGIDTHTRWKWIGITAYLTIFFPIFTVFLAWKLKFVKSIFLKTKKDRIVPYIAIMVYYFWIYEVFKRSIHAPFMLNVLFLGAFWGIIVLYIVNIFLKISMHTTAAGGMIGIMVLLMFSGSVSFFIPFLIALLLAGIIGTARMILYAHTPTELWLGYLVGFITQIAAYFFLK